MRIITCLDPQHIVNPYTHQHLTVACGKCTACRNAMAKRWIDKLEQERRCWKFTYMVTLTYDDKHLPRLYDNGSCVLVDPNHSDMRIPFEELQFKSPKDTKYFNSRLNHRLGVPYARVDDIQKFHKRLNKYIHDKITQKYQNFRYFLISEFGSDTLRPHYHALYFFNDRRIARDFKKILFETWQNTDNFENGLTADSVRGTASSYVAQYMRSFSDLPSFYQSGKLKPFFTFSKCPPLGSLECDEEKVRKTFFSASPTRTIYESKRNQFIDVRLSHSLENRLYPRLPKYSEISLSCRVKLYGLCRELNQWSFESFCYALKEAFKSPFPRFSLSNKTELNNEFTRYIFWLTNNFKLSDADYIDIRDYNLVQSRLKRFYYVSNRVCSQADVFGISVNNYVSVIDDYFKNLEQFKTKCFYASQENYSQSCHDVEDLCHMYDDGEQFLMSNQFEYFPSYETTFAFHDLMATSKKIFNDSTKKHKSNQYLDKCRDKKLSLILKDYFANV